MRAVFVFMLIFPTLALAAPPAEATVQTWYDVTKDFQTLIAAALGFTGVIFTMIVQGKQARAQRQSEAENAAQSMKQALDAEIKTLAAQLRSNAQNIEDRPKHPDTVPALPIRPLNHVYRALLPKFDLLQPSDVTRVTRANLLYEQFFMRLHFLGKTKEQFPDQIGIFPEFIDTVVDFQRNTADWMENPPKL